MTSYFCDFCNASVTMGVKGDNWHIRVYEPGGYVGFKYHYDICSDCVKKLEEIREKKVLVYMAKVCNSSLGFLSRLWQ